MSEGSRMDEERIREIVREEIQADIIRRNKEAFEKEINTNEFALLREETPYDRAGKNLLGEPTDPPKLSLWSHYCSHFNREEYWESYILVCPYCHATQPDKEELNNE